MAYVLISLLAAGAVVALILFKSFSILRTSRAHFDVDAARSSSKQLTIRVNTFRRPDLLRIFLDNYSKCECVKQIQIVWSDPETIAPYNWVKDYKVDKVVFETHKRNSLNNRFNGIIGIQTEVISIFTPSF
jgi:Glycosyl transferase family 64 domain